MMISSVFSAMARLKSAEFECSQVFQDEARQGAGWSDILIALRVHNNVFPIHLCFRTFGRRNCFTAFEVAEH